MASPLKLSVTPVVQRHAPPTLGQHTTEVLQELLALSAGELSALRASGVIA